VIESGVHEICKAAFIQRQARGDQIYIESRGAGGPDKFD
jgi:hypothetical protein